MILSLRIKCWTGERAKQVSTLATRGSGGAVGEAFGGAALLEAPLPV